MQSKKPSRCISVFSNAFRSRGYENMLELIADQTYEPYPSPVLVIGYEMEIEDFYRDLHEFNAADGAPIFHFTPKVHKKNAFSIERELARMPRQTPDGKELTAEEIAAKVARRLEQEKERKEREQQRLKEGKPHREFEYGEDEIPFTLEHEQSARQLINLINRGDDDGLAPGQLKTIVMLYQNDPKLEAFLPLLLEQTRGITVYRVLFGTFMDLSPEEMEEVKEHKGLVPCDMNPDAQSLVVSDLNSFLEKEIPPRKPLLVLDGTDTVILYAQSINQIFAWRGTGKSMFAMALCGALAKGSKFLAYRAPQKAKVVYAEGEMPAAQMQERLRELVGAVDKGYFRLVTIDEQPGHEIGSLATAAGRAALEAQVRDAEVLVIDSISTLANIPTNDEEAWLELLAWLRKLRSKGLCIIFLHHAGKSGMQRGHSRSEDMLDVSIKLEGDATEERDDVKFTMKFDKFRDRRRGIRSLNVEYRDKQWTYSLLEAEELELLRTYLAKHPNASNRKVEEATGIGRNRVKGLKEKLAASKQPAQQSFEDSKTPF